jgi:hypothetical protein
VIEEAARRRELHVMLLGDRPPGRSALDWQQR